MQKRKAKKKGGSNKIRILMKESMKIKKMRFN